MWAVGAPQSLLGASALPGQVSSPLAESEVAPILEKLNMPKAKVLAIRQSPVAGFWEVGVENGGRRFVIYVDPSRKYVTPGPFIDYASRRDITRERVDELNRDRRIDVSRLSLNEALVIGKRDAPVRVVIFTDPG
jgi:thiol:disulfide interchange protein DsbC